MYNRVAPCEYDVGAKVTSLNEEASEKQKRVTREKRERLGVESSVSVGGGWLGDVNVFTPCILFPVQDSLVKIVVLVKMHP